VIVETGPVYAFIPARGGSRGVPGKNLRPLGGKPLLAWAIEVATQVARIDRIVVSTDDEDIAREAEAWGAEAEIRPAHLATDTALVVDAIRHHIAEWARRGEPAGIVVLLQPTSPFRTSSDIGSCLDALAGPDGADSVATFCEAEFNPQQAWRIVGSRAEPFAEGTVSWAPRQAQPKAYQLNGAVYAFRADALPPDTSGLLFGRHAAVVMPPERSFDIDTELDFRIVEALLAQTRP
jgi:N-acylneuraminate cytidylyltransferase